MFYFRNMKRLPRTGTEGERTSRRATYTREWSLNFSCLYQHVNITLLDVQSILPSRVVVSLASVPHFIAFAGRDLLHTEKRNSSYTDECRDVGWYVYLRHIIGGPITTVLQQLFKPDWFGRSILLYLRCWTPGNEFEVNSTLTPNEGLQRPSNGFLGDEAAFCKINCKSRSRKCSSPWKIKIWSPSLPPRFFVNTIGR